MVAIHLDANYFFVQPMRSRSKEEMIRAYKKIINRKHTLDNKALEEIIENKTVRIEIEGKKSPFHHIPITKTHEAFFRIEDLSNSIHTDQTGAFPFTSQQGNRYIMVAIHLDANYIFVKSMHSRSKEEMIRAMRK